MEKKVRIIKYKFSFGEIVKIVINFILAFACLAGIGYGVYLVIRVIPMFKDYYIVQGNPFSFPKLILYIFCTAFIFGFMFMDGILFNAIFVSILALVIFVVCGKFLYRFVWNIKYYFDNKKTINDNPMYYGYYEIVNDTTDSDKEDKTEYIEIEKFKS